VNTTKISNSPATFSMTLGTAREIVATADKGWRPHQIEEARRVVAYWTKRSAKKRST
jgi:hypothetical protein